MRVLITGIGGHIGSALARWLHQNVQCQVDGIDNFTSGYAENVGASNTHTLWATDLQDLKRIEPYDYVFHFAAMAAECLSPFVRRQHVLANLASSAALLSAVLEAGECKRLVFASSAAVYGIGTPPFSETDVCRPLDPYGAGKLYVERDLEIAREQHGQEYCVLRMHNVYGPGQSIWDQHRNVFGIWMRAALEGRPLRCFGDGSQIRAFSYIDDVIPCIWRAATEPAAANQVINLGSGRPTTLVNAGHLVGSIVGAKLEFAEPRHEVHKSVCTTSKSRELLGYESRMDLGTGLEAMWEWARFNWDEYPERRNRKPPAIEVSRGLYPAWA